MSTFPYDSSETPPAPYIDLQLCPLRHPNRLIRVRAKLDSGAGLTVIPLDLVNRWRLQEYGRIRVQGFNGTISIRSIYRIDLSIGSRWFRDIAVTATRRSNILLGRDILNQFCITLDGPRQIVEIHDSIWSRLQTKLKSWLKLR